MLSKTVSLAALSLTLGFLAVPASAAPVASVNGAQAGISTSAAEPVGYRRCWYRNGQRQCRWVDGGYDTYGYRDAYGYRPGVGNTAGRSG